jgi:DUF4097 and DUF4098 domain-containing protein YvlB
MLLRIMPWWLSWTIVGGVAGAPPEVPCPAATAAIHPAACVKMSATASQSVQSQAIEATTIDTTVAFATSGGVADLRLVSGEITVVGWDRPEVKIHATSEDTPIRLEASANRVLLESREATRGEHRGEDVTFNLFVPRGTHVLMHSISGDLTAHGVKGELVARTTSGSVQVDNAGPTVLESVSGDVTGRALTGPVRVSSVSGDVQLGDVAGDVEVSTVSGDISIPEARSKIARIESVSGDIRYHGPIDPTGRYDFQSHSGDVTLRIPAATQANVSLQTFSGSLQSAFPLSVNVGSDDPDHHRGHFGRRVDTKLGDGGAELCVETFSGDIAIERAQ